MWPNNAVRTGNGVTTPFQKVGKMARRWTAAVFACQKLSGFVKL